MRVCPKCCTIASSPKVNRAQVSELMLAAVKSPLKDDAQAKNLVRMLVDNHRLPLLPDIATQFEELKNAREGAADALIVSAFPLDGAQLSELVAGLERKFKSKLKPTVQVDPSLIGGVRVRDGRRRSARHIGPRAAHQHAVGAYRLMRVQRRAAGTQQN